MQVQTESLGPAFNFTPDYTRFTGLMSRTSCTRHSTFMPMRSATAWSTRSTSVFQDGHPEFEAQVFGDAEGGRDQAASRSCWRRSGSTRPIRSSGAEVSTSIVRLSSTSWSAPDGRSMTAANLFGELKPLRADVGAPSAASPRVWPASKVFGIRTEQGGACRGSEEHSRRAQRAADEGGADSLHHSRTRCQRNTRTELAHLQANAPPMGWNVRAAADGR